MKIYVKKCWKCKNMGNI